MFADNPVTAISGTLQFRGHSPDPSIPPSHQSVMRVSVTLSTEFRQSCSVPVAPPQHVRRLGGTRGGGADQPAGRDRVFGILLKGSHHSL